MGYNLGYFYIIIANLAQAFNPIWLKKAFQLGSDPYRILFSQAIFTLPLIFFIVLIIDRTKFAIKAQDLLAITVQCICGFFFSAFFYNLAIAKMNASLVVLAFYTYPIFTMLGGWLFFKSRVKAAQWIAVAVVLGGVVLLANPSLEGFNLWGFILALLAAASQAFYMLYGEKNLKSLHPLTITFYGQVGFIIPCLLTMPYWPTGVFLDPASLKYGFILAILSSFFGFFFVLLAQQTLSSGVTALLTTFRLPISLILVHFLLHEAFSPYMSFGAILIFAGIILGLERPKATEKLEKSI